MTNRLIFSLDLNANDFDALQAVLKNPRVVATAVAPDDPWERARILDVLIEIEESMAAAVKPVMAGEYRQSD